MSLSSPSPQGSGCIRKGDGKKTVRAKGDKWHQGNSSSGYNRINMNSQRLRQHEQDLHVFKTGGGSWHKVPPLTKKSVFSSGVPLGVSIHSRAGSTTKSCWPTQNRLYVIGFVFVLFCSIDSGFVWFLYFCLFLFSIFLFVLRDRKNMKISKQKSGEELRGAGMRKNMIKLYENLIKIK